MSKQEWVSMNTDGPFCPLARVYDKNEAAELFKDFKNVDKRPGSLIRSIGH